MKAPSWKALPEDWRTDSGQKLFYRALGDEVRRLRRDVGWSQERLGAIAQLSGPTIGMIESGRQRVTVFHLVRIAAAFNCSISDLCPAPTV